MSLLEVADIRTYYGAIEALNKGLSLPPGVLLLTGASALRNPSLEPK